MKCLLPMHCLSLGLVLLIAGCSSMGRNSVASQQPEAERQAVDDLADDDTPIKTASAESEFADDTGDAPPPQPGVKGTGSRSKLAGFLKGRNEKSAAIPVARTDKNKSHDEESLAEEETGLWNHSEESTALSKSSNSKARQDAASSEDDSELSLGGNPFVD